MGGEAFCNHSSPLFSSPTFIAVALVATSIPIALLLESIGKNPGSPVSPSAKAKVEANYAAREVRSKKNK
jgi:hypothetical protein